jgi:hypothetical protein
MGLSRKGAKVPTGLYSMEACAGEVTHETWSSHCGDSSGIWRRVVLYIFIHVSQELEPALFTTQPKDAWCKYYLIFMETVSVV